jgi:hypothetical protein
VAGAVLAVRANRAVTVAFNDQALEPIDVLSSAVGIRVGIADQGLCHAKSFAQHLRVIRNLIGRHAAT